MPHINMLNKSGPRIEPWGTQESIAFQEQEKESIFVLCLSIAFQEQEKESILFFAFDYLNNLLVY